MTSVPKGISGVILPPPQMRDVADKLALKVATSGKAFEQKVYENNKAVPLFKFLEEGCPFHSYYLSRVDDFKVRLAAGEEIDLEKEKAAEAEGAEADDAETRPEKKSAHTKTKLRGNPFEKIFTVSDQGAMPFRDLEIIKLTARYVATHGKAFLSQIAQKERNNPAFDFLKGSSPRFATFQAFLKAYTAILSPPKDMVERLQDDCENRMSILTHANDIVAWRKEDEEVKQQRESEAETERVAYQSIDWQDFVIVETIDFTEAPQAAPAEPPSVPLPPSGELPPLSTHVPAATPTPVPTPLPPVPPAPVASSAAPPPPVAPPAPPPPPQGPAPTIKPGSSMRNVAAADDDFTANLRTGYVRDTLADRKRKANVLDPSGRVIPADAAEEHMRRSTINPQWQKQKVRLQDDLASSVYVSDQESAQHLQRMMAQRPKDPEDVLEERLKRQKKEQHSADAVRRAAEKASGIFAKEEGQDQQ